VIVTESSEPAPSVDESCVVKAVPTGGMVEKNRSASVDGEIDGCREIVKPSGIAETGDEKRYNSCALSGKKSTVVSELSDSGSSVPGVGSGVGVSKYTTVKLYDSVPAVATIIHHD